MVQQTLRGVVWAMAAMVLVCAPLCAQAGVGDLFSRAAGWWQSRALVASAEEGGTDQAEEGSVEEPSEVPDAETDDAAAPEEDADDEPAEESGPSRIPGKCVVPQEPPVTRCELGAGFLCVNTPPGGVAREHVIVRGTIDRRGSVLASLRIAAQHEYTKQTVHVPTDPASSAADCWTDDAPEAFCLDADGRFAVPVSLAEQGPYTITITASRLSGETIEKRVRTSRVTALDFGDDRVAFDPDVRASTSVDANHVLVTAQLLDGCSFCDFIGASTGGVTLTVHNDIRGPDGSVRQVTCASTVEQGGQGRYVVGVPTFPGENRLTVTACNAAVEGACPAIEGIAFTAGGDVGQLEILSPPPQPSYDAQEWPTLPWRFSLGSEASCVTLHFNREAPRELCPDSAGEFSAELSPKVGINVATLSTTGHGDDFAWTFGWGRIATPYGDAGGDLTLPVAAQLAIPKATAADILIPLFNHFFASDEFDDLLADLLDGFGAEEGAPADDDDSPAPVTIPKCDGGGLGGFGYGLRGRPAIGGIRIKEPGFGADRLELAVVLDDVRVGLDLFPDKDSDGRPDKAKLPLVIDLQKARLDIDLLVEEEEGLPRILLSSPHDDCAYKRGSYCKHKPAALLPKNLIGGANGWGGFVRCDVGRAAGEAKEACRAINSLNGQTGVVSEKVLDAVNDAIYCSGSAALTRIARDGMRLPEVRIGCEEDEACEGVLAALAPVAVPVGLMLDDLLGISSSGLFVQAGVAVGERSTYARTPESFRVESAGIALPTGKAAGALAGPGEARGDLEAAVSLDALNAFLFAATVQGDGRAHRGLLDIDVHAPFFASIGFDFAQECDAFVPVPGEQEEPPTLCHIRTRVGELLGSALTTYGYFDQKAPLMIAVRANRALAPRIAAASIDDLPTVPRGGEDNPAFGDEEVSTNPTGELLAVELGGVELGFYALEEDLSAEPDAYGNRPLLLDENGRPVIRSMRPDDSDPWNGPIVRFDLSLLLGIEVSPVQIDPEDESQFVVNIRTLADRSRLVLTAVEGSNATTVPDAGLLSALNEKIALAIAGLTPEEKAIAVPIPREIALEANDDGVFGMLGLARIDFGADGLSLELDAKHNFARVAVSALLTQILHVDGEEREYSLPQE